MDQRIVRGTFAALLMAGAGAQAAVTVFNDEAAFVAATAATWASLPIPSGGSVIANSTTAGDLLITTRLAVFDAAHPYCDGICLSGMASTLNEPMFGVSGGENFDVTTSPSSTQLYAFGLGIYEPKSVTRGNNTAAVICGGGQSLPCVESKFSFTLYDGTTPLGSFDFEPGNDAWVFWGVQSTLPFDKVTVREIVGTNDNEMFARFHYASTYYEPPVGTAPEPSTLALFAVAAGAALRVRRRRR